MDILLNNLVEETEDLSSNVSSSGLLVVHDSGRSGQDDVTKLSRRQQVLDPLLHIINFDVESGRNDTTLVESAVQLDNDLAGSVVINVGELVDVT